MASTFRSMRVRTHQLQSLSPMRISSQRVMKLLRLRVSKSRTLNLELCLKGRSRQLRRRITESRQLIILKKSERMSLKWMPNQKTSLNKCTRMKFQSQTRQRRKTSKRKMSQLKVKMNMKPMRSRLKRNSL